jgi:hypothetical protein
LILWAGSWGGPFPYRFAIPIAFIPLNGGLLFLQLSRSLGREAEQRQRTANEEALMAWATQSGASTAEDAARAAGISVDAADRILTDVAKREPERLAIDVGEDGVLRYRPIGECGGGRPRIDSAAAGARVVVDGEFDPAREEIESPREAHEITSGKRRE